MCDLCTRNKKVFTHEHELFTPHELRTHQKFGDDNPGAVDQSGFRGHPECGFCRERFYGDDELYTHCRDKHEKCHICDRRNGGRNPQYYVNYESLEKHFGKDHYLCLEQDCLDKKFVVFESEMDLKAHQLESHANSLSKDVRRDARLVDMSTFDYRERYQDNRGGRRGRGRGRDPNAEPIPASSAQPMRRDELAFQRQMAIQSAQSVSNRTFGGQLTTNTASQTPMAVSTTARPQSTQTDIPIENLNIRSEVVPTTDLTPQEQARRIQHGAVMDRASALLQNEPTKISDFRARVSSYKNSAITATELIDAFFALFDVSPTDLGKLIKELASIYENESKRSDLLKAWNDWRAINEDYPSLPGPDASIPTAAPVGGGGRRILKLKSSTAQSSRSAVNREVAWGNQAPPGAAVFPSLAAAANRIGRGRVGTTPWATATTSSAPRPNPTIRMSAAPASSAPKANLGGSDAFPALPATAKPNTSIFGLHRGTVRWDDNKGQALSNPWASGANSGANASGTASEAEADEGAGAKGGKKKQKKGKEVLYKFG